MNDSILIPTERRGKLLYVRLVEVYNFEADASGVSAEVLVHLHGNPKQEGLIIVSGETLNNAHYAQVLFDKPFLVWEDDVEWLNDVEWDDD